MALFDVCHLFLRNLENFTSGHVVAKGHEHVFRVIGIHFLNPVLLLSRTRRETITTLLPHASAGASILSYEPLGLKSSSTASVVYSFQYTEGIATFTLNPAA